MAVAILSIRNLGTQAISKALDWVFMTLLPNYCLGQSMSNFYLNYMFLNACQPFLPNCPYACLFHMNNSCCKGVIFLFTCNVVEN